MLQLTTKTTAPVVEFNFEELKDRAEQIVAEFTKEAVTEDSYKAAKAAAKELAGYAGDVDKARKEVKKALSEPITAFEAQCKEIFNILKDGQASIEEKTNFFDKQRREEKRQTAEGIIQASIVKFGLTPKYAAQLTMKDEYTKLTATKKAVTEDVENIAVQLKVRQTHEAKLLALIESAINSYNNMLEQKFALDEVVHQFQGEINLALDDATEAHDDYVMVKINEVANKRFKAEKAIKEKALLDAAEAEAEKAARESEAADAIANDPIMVSQEEMDTIAKKARTKLATEAKEEIENLMDKISFPMTLGEIAEEFMHSFLQTQKGMKATDSKWQIAFTVTGTGKQTQAISEFIRAIGATAQVDAGKSHKI